MLFQNSNFLLILHKSLIKWQINHYYTFHIVYKVYICKFNNIYIIDLAVYNAIVKILIPLNIKNLKQEFNT